VSPDSSQTSRLLFHDFNGSKAMDPFILFVVYQNYQINRHEADQLCSSPFDEIHSETFSTRYICSTITKGNIATTRSQLYETTSDSHRSSIPDRIAGIMRTGFSRSRTRHPPGQFRDGMRPPRGHVVTEICQMNSLSRLRRPIHRFCQVLTPSTGRSHEHVGVFKRVQEGAHGDPREVRLLGATTTTAGRG